MAPIPEDVPVFPADKTTVVKETWKEVIDSGPVVETGIMIYERLFSEHPELMTLFSFADGKSMSELRTNKFQKRHARSVMNYVSKAVDNLEDLSNCYVDIYNLGYRHGPYGTKMDQFGAVGDAILHMVGRRLGDRFTPERKQVMTDFYMDVVVKITAKGLQDSIDDEAA